MAHAHPLHRGPRLRKSRELIGGGRPVVMIAFRRKRDLIVSGIDDVVDALGTIPFPPSIEDSSRFPWGSIIRSNLQHVTDYS
jgi:hypothetical protein